MNSRNALEFAGFCHARYSHSLARLQLSKRSITRQALIGSDMCTCDVVMTAARQERAIHILFAMTKLSPYD